MFQESTTTRPYELRAHTTKSLLARLYRDVSTLVTEEVDLAKSEGRERGGLALTAARAFAFSTACALLALSCLSACVIAALAGVMSFWLAALIVGVAYALAAFALRGVAGRSLKRAAEPALSQLDVLLSPAAAGGTLAERKARAEWTRKQVEQTLDALAHKTDLGPPMRDTALGLGALGIAVTAIARTGNREN